MMFMYFSLPAALSGNLQYFHKKVIRRAYVMTASYLTLMVFILISYFYGPVLIHFIKFYLGRDDLSYPFVLNANYLIVDPRKSDLAFAVYTILSRYYINFYLMGYFIMDAFLVALFFYISCFMEAVKIKFQALASKEMDEVEFTRQVKELIEEQVMAINMVKICDRVTRYIMLSQFVLFSFSFCFVLFNLTKVVAKIVKVFLFN